MKYTVETTARFDREFRKLDRYTQKMLRAWIESHLVNCEDPRSSGKALSGSLSSFWRYRIGDYRIIADIQDSRLVILALTIGHRRDVYN